ncbi:MAG: LamG domain-containing protein, partial [Verrucomicrobia bacterium]|nr:LamG domain-containing protein [Verrucomicrobiota bacterium]
MKIRVQVHRSLLAASATALLALAAVLPAQADYSNTVASLNPVAYWRLNEPVSPTLNYALGTATNVGSLGTVANGTYYHSSTLQEPGVLTTDTCVKLDGTTEYIEVPYTPVLNTNGPFSVEFWANETVVAAGAKSGVMSFSGNTGFLFYTDNNGPNWGFRVFFGTGRTYVVDNGPANQPDTWNHVVGVFDGTLVHIYVNGVENAPAQAIGGSGYVPNTTAPLRIGAGNTAGPASLFFPGWMDEVAMYPYALSSTQIAAHYTAATANPAGYAALITSENPTAYWRLNEPLLPPEPAPVMVVVTNKGSWGALANGAFNSGGMSSGAPGVPYHGFGTSNTACQFPGTTGSYIEIPAQSLVTDSWTITCWAKRNGISQYWSMLYSNPSDLGLPTAGASEPVTGVGFQNNG